MFGIENLWLYILSGLVLNVMPGPDSLYIFGRSIAQGFKAGSVATLGVGAGTMIHVFAAALGLSAILATSAAAFSILKILGCIYLVYIGLMLVMSSAEVPDETNLNTKVLPFSSIFLQGFLTNILNPKAALFFLAFAPQFIPPESESKAMAFIILGLIFNFNGMIWCQILAWSASSVSKRIRASGIVIRWSKRLAGTLFGYFGVKLAMSSQN